VVTFYKNRKNNIYEMHRYIEFVSKHYHHVNLASPLPRSQPPSGPSVVPPLPSTFPPSQYRQLFQELVDRHAGAALYFTDGFWGEEGVGVGMAYGDKTVVVPLPPLSSVFTAEATALERALKLACHSPQSIFFIASYSLSCLQSLQHFRPTHPTILRALLGVCPL
jgi:hypothetical protein